MRTFFILSVPESVVIQDMKNFHTIETIKIIDQAYQFSILVRITKSQHLIGYHIQQLFYSFFSCLPFQRTLDAMLWLQPIGFGTKLSHLSTHRFQLAGYIAAYCTFLPISTSSAWFSKSSNWTNVNSFFICNSYMISRAQTSAQNGSISQNISNI